MVDVDGLPDMSENIAGGRTHGDVPLAFVCRDWLGLALFFWGGGHRTPSSEIERGVYHYRQEERWRRDLHSDLS